MLEPKVIHYAKFTDRGVVIYPSFELFNKFRNLEPRELDNLKDNKTKGIMSAKSKKKVATIANNWISAIITYMRCNKIPKDLLSKKLTFCTLTLSSTQIHCDKVIKRECLNYFMITLKRKTKLKNYLWVSEKQKNGNVHFHLLFDKFISWRLVRDLWNEAQNKLGYIDRFEEKHEHKDANSTDIKSLRSIENPSAYITKYITKDEDKNSQCGRMWNCSKRLKEVESYTQLIDPHLSSSLSNLIQKHPENVYEADYVTIIKIKKQGIRQAVSKKIADHFDNHFLEAFNFLNSE